MTKNKENKKTESKCF